MIYLNPGDDIQSVLKSVPNNIAHRTPIQIVLNPGRYTTSDTLTIDSRTIIYGYGAELFANHNNDAIAIGLSSEPYYTSIYGLTISGPTSYSTSDGIFVEKANFLSLRDCIILRFDKGISLTGYDPVDVSIENTYINGCRIGIHAVGANVLYYNGGKIIGDRSRYQDGVALHIEKTTCVYVVNLDCSIHRGGAAIIDSVAGGILNLYTEDIGIDYKLPNPPTTNNIAVLDIKNTNSLFVSGFCNAIAAPIGLPYDCNTGIRIANSSGIFINSLINGPKSYEIEVMDDVSDFVFNGSVICPFNKRYKPRIRKPKYLSVDVPFLQMTNTPSVNWDEISSTITILNNQVQLQESKSLVEYQYTVGERYIFTCDVDVLSESHDINGSGRLAYRLRLGNGSDSSFIDTPISLGCKNSLRVDWTPKTSGNQFCVLHSSRLNSTTSKNYGLFSAKLSNMKLIKVTNV